MYLFNNTKPINGTNLAKSSMLLTKFTLACFVIILGVLISGVFSVTQAQLLPNIDFKSGRVLARSVVINPDTGLPILVEFDQAGEEVSEVSLGDVSVADVLVVPAADYRFFRQQLVDFQNDNADNLAIGAEILSRNEFEQASFLLADNSTALQQIPLTEGINSVLVRGQGNRLINPGAGQATNSYLVLRQFTFDFTQEITIDDDAISLVVNRDGQILAQSANTIGFRVGFFGDPNVAQDTSRRIITQDDTVFGPVPFVKVNVDDIVYPGGVDFTNNEGRYSFTFLLPTCPLGGFTFTTDIFAELSYRNFLPTGAPNISYYLRTPSTSTCFAGFNGSPLLPTFTTSLLTSGFQSNLFVDVSFLGGTIVLRNVNGDDVEVGDTTYTTFEAPAEQTTQNFYDFNGDGQPDHVVQGRILECIATDSGDDQPETVDVFLPAPSGSGNDDISNAVEGFSCIEPNPVATITENDGGGWQGLFFDGQQDDVFDYPDIVRVIDRELRNEPIGVLQSISRDDLRNTDILIFRESTGQLILERRGLKEEEAQYRRAVEYDEEDNEVAYRILFRGARDSNLNIGGGVNRQASFNEWATDYQLTEPFQNRASDHPRPGEFIKIVAINRATGYTGTARVQLQSAGQNGTNLLDTQVPTITLTPPNLKVWAEREYEVELGLTQGEDREYTIGNEGASLTSDTTITVFSEWLDERGQPLPDELGLDDGAQYGLTGRLARVVGQNQLRGAGASDDMAEFPIGPGRTTQALRIRNDAANGGSEHFYVHVIGKPREQECVAEANCPSFDITSDQDGLEGRPSLLTPFLTPLYDDDTTQQQANAFRQANEAFEEQENPDETLRPLEPLPTYVWQYRPEYQFSQFELEINEINRTITDEDGDDEVINIIESDNPTIASSDDLLSILIDIIANEADRLTPIDGDQELILSLGEQEQRVTIGADQTITFDDIGSLSTLDAEDFLTISVATNNDAGNILWEYAFYYLHVDINLVEADEWDGECFPISADDPTLELYSFIQGYRPDGGQAPPNILWNVNGQGVIIDSSRTVDDFGFTENILVMPRERGAQARVEAIISGDQTPAFFEYACVTSGEPAALTVEKEGQVFTSERGEAQLIVDVRDAWGNAVEDDTTVDFIPSGEVIITEVNPHTQSGMASVTVTGVNAGGDNDGVLVYIDSQLSEFIPIEIEPIDIQVLAPTTVESGQEFTVQIVTSPPTEDLQLILSSDVGSLRESRVTTDSSGIAEASILANEQTSEGVVNVILDFELAATAQINIENQSQILSSQLPVLVGTETQDGFALVTDQISGFAFEADHNATTEIVVAGEPGEIVDVRLGSAEKRVEKNELYYPMSYRLGDTVYDEAGRNHAFASNITVVDDTPRFNGRSFEFEETVIQAARDSFVRLDDASRFQFDTDWGLSIYAKLRQQQIQGELINLGEGIKLSVDTSNIVVDILSDSGNVTLQAPISSFDEWININVERLGDSVSLKVNQTIAETESITGSIIFESPSLTLGRDLNGRLAEFRSYRIGSESQAIVEFADGSLEQEVLVGPQGTATLTLISTGSMDGFSAAQEVAVTANGQELTVAVLSLRTHHELVLREILSERDFFDAINESAGLNVVDNSPALPSSLFSILVADANAQNVSNIRYGRDRLVRKRANFRLPDWITVFGDEQFYQDIARGIEQFVDDELEGIGEQLGEAFDEIGEAIASGEFNKIDASILLMRGALAIPLVRRYLSRAFEPIIRFLDRFSDRPIAGHLADLLLRVLKPTLSGNFDALFASVYGILFIADMTELVVSGDAPEILDTINLVIEGVESANDLDGIFTFVRQVALSADDSCLQDLNTIDFVDTRQTTSFLSHLIPEAHAQRGVLRVLKRVDVRPFFRGLRRAINRLDTQEERPGGNPKRFNLAKFLAGLGTVFSGFDVLSQSGTLADEASEILENILDDRILLAGMVVSHRKTPAALGAMIRGNLPLRMRPIELLLAIAQIESSIADGKLDSEQYTLDLVIPRESAEARGRQLKWVVRDKYDKVFINVIANGGPRNIPLSRATAYVRVNQLNGEAFHLSNIAALLSQDIPIIGIEGLVNIRFYQTDPVTRVPAPFGSPLRRRVDIVSGVIGSETWWEIKSLGFNRRNAGSRRNLVGISSGLTTLDLSDLSSQFRARANGIDVILDEGSLKVKAGQFYSKEFFVDRVFAGAEIDEVPERMQWVLHSFRKVNMNAFRLRARVPVVDAEEFVQCGVNSPAGNCSSIYGDRRPNPLSAIRTKLVNSIRNPNQNDVRDVIFNTFENSLSLNSINDVRTYISDFEDIGDEVIISKSAGSWIIQPASSSCEVP